MYNVDMLTVIGSCYKLLRLEEDCSDLQLRQQYRKIALRSHPDRQPDRNSQEFIAATQAYRKILSFRKMLTPKQNHQEQ